MHILFVCSGNTCRSPMAEALFTDQWTKRSNPCQRTEIIARSAGIYVFSGQPASQETIEVMAEMGIDISRHQAKKLDRDLVEWADLILVMTQEHYRLVVERYPVPPERVSLLGRFSLGHNEDVLDPFGSGIGAYRRCAKQIQSMIIEIVKKLS